MNHELDAKTLLTALADGDMQDVKLLHALAVLGLSEPEAAARLGLSASEVARRLCVLHARFCVAWGPGA